MSRGGEVAALRLISGGASNNQGGGQEGSGGGDGRQTGDPPPPPPTPPRDPGLKFRAKRINEHVKSVYSVANTLGAAIIGAAFIIPAVTKGSNGPDLDAPGWCLIGLVLILGGHAAIWRFMRSEE